MPSFRAGSGSRRSPTRSSRRSVPADSRNACAIASATAPASFPSTSTSSTRRSLPGQAPPRWEAPRAGRRSRTSARSPDSTFAASTASRWRRPTTRRRSRRSSRRTRASRCSPCWPCAAEGRGSGGEPQSRSPSRFSAFRGHESTEGLCYAGTKQEPSMGLSGILTRPFVRTPTSQGAKLGQVIAFANQKGGVAKTTTTLNLAVAFKEQGFSVLGVDLDPQGNLTMSQGMDPDTVERSMFDVLVHSVPIEEVIHRTEIDLAVSSIDLAGAELALSSMIGRERALQKALLPVRSRYDYVLVDTPPSLGLLTINALTASDGVIVPVQCEYLSLRGLVQLENTLSMIRENLNPTVEIRGILPTMYDGRTLHSREAVEMLKENFGELVFETRIRKTVRYAEAPVQGSSVLKYDPSGTAAEAYRELAKEVLDGATPRQHA